MKNQALTLFIVDNKASLTEGLSTYLCKRFGGDLNIFTFNDSASALKKVDKHTDIVILDYKLKGTNGNEVLSQIKKINPKTEVILLTSNEEISVAIESFKLGATDYVLKGNKSWKKIESLVLKIITYPIHVLVKEFGFSKYFAIFILTFVTIGAVVLVALQMIGLK